MPDFKATPTKQLLKSTYHIVKNLVDPSVGIFPLFGSYQHHNRTYLGTGAQQLFHQQFPQKSGTPCYEHTFPGVEFRNFTTRRVVTDLVLLEQFYQPFGGGFLNRGCCHFGGVIRLSTKIRFELEWDALFGIIGGGVLQVKLLIRF